MRGILSRPILKFPTIAISGTANKTISATFSQKLGESSLFYFEDESKPSKSGTRIILTEKGMDKLSEYADQLIAYIKELEKVKQSKNRSGLTKIIAPEIRLLEKVEKEDGHFYNVHLTSWRFNLGIGCMVGIKETAVANRDVQQSWCLVGADFINLMDVYIPLLSEMEEKFIPNFFKMIKKSENIGEKEVEITGQWKRRRIGKN